MWQEARKHERKLRGMMVDYKRRGERRREYYEKIKKDPAQFLQVHGRAYKIHLDSAVALAAESPLNMMPWQGDTSNMIDRFDVRAHLDYIPTYTPTLLNTTTPEQESEERKCNYERYRGLVQNDFANISEEQCLYQIYVDELYGGLQKPNEDEKKKLAEKKAQIGYTYEDTTVTEPDEQMEKGSEDDSENSESEEDEVIPDIDVEVDVDELNPEQVTEINKMATTYGMADEDFVWMLRKDKEEVEAIKHAKALEAEKAMYSGRRSRRQRREFREKYMKGRQISPPSYARRDSPTYDPYKRPESDSSSESRSRSRTPGNDKITFITSFGGSDDEGASAAQAPPAAVSSHTSSNTAGHSRGSRRRRSSSSHSSFSSHSSSHRSSCSSSRSRRSRQSRGGRDRNSRYSRSRSRRRSDSRSRQRSGGVGSRKRYDRTRSRSTDRGRDRNRERDRDRDRGRRYTGRRRTRQETSKIDSLLSAAILCINFCPTYSKVIVSIAAQNDATREAQTPNAEGSKQDTVDIQGGNN
uniref:CLK4-associating serine/arginine rich protein-like n=1 Tax=Sinocyclocheilus rhinocerous TaxID=307959 RepID=A0A673H3M5_9TELE